MEAYVTEEIIPWARKRMDISRDELARALDVKVSVLAAWEDGESYPSFTKAEELARRLRIPFGYLFLNEPPRERAPLPDFRTVDEGNPHTISPDFFDVLNDVVLRQRWYREYRIDQGGQSLGFVGRFSVSIDPNVLADNISHELQINDDLRHESRSWDDYLRLLVRNAESTGILVMRSGIVGANVYRKLSVGEFRGFAISDAYAPLIFVNGRDVKVAQIFTLAHELAHIWIGRSGISNPDPANPKRMRGFAVEDLCNAAAAQLLLPAQQFTHLWTGAGSKDLQRLATHFRVSLMVVIRRAHDLGLLDSDRFVALVVEEKHRQEQRLKDRHEKEQSGGGDFYNTFPSRNSLRFTRAVLEAFRTERTAPLEAARLLGVKTSTLASIFEHIGASAK